MAIFPSWRTLNITGMGAIGQSSHINWRMIMITLVSDSRSSVLLQAAVWVLNDMSVQVHPIPSFDNLTAFDLMVDKMEELGLWFMYDMRW
jgi:hypothetical protein